MKIIFTVLGLIFSFSAFSQFSLENISDLSNWENLRKVSYDYDENGNKVYTEMENWDLKTRDWLNFSNSVAEFDEGGQLVASTNSKFIGNNYEAIENSHFDYIDEEGLSLIKTSKNINAKSGEMTKGIKTITNQLKNGVKETETLYWNKKTGDWIEGTLLHETFDSEGDLLSRLSKRWDDKIVDWVNNTKIAIKWADNKREKEFVQEKWDKNQNKWTDKTKTLTYWNSRKTAVTHEITSQWNYKTLLWEETKKCTVFPIGKNKEHFISEKFNVKENKWENLARNFYYYNSDRKLEEAVYQSWDKEQGDFISTKRTLLKLNIKGEVVQKIFQAALPKQFDTPKEKIKCVYANPYPIGSRINCSCFDEKTKPEVQIIDVNGRVLIQQSGVQDDFKIKKNLPSGNYIMIIHQDKKIIHLEKLVIARDVNYP